MAKLQFNDKVLRTIDSFASATITQAKCNGALFQAELGTLDFKGATFTNGANFKGAIFECKVVYGAMFGKGYQRKFDDYEIRDTRSHQIKQW